MILETLDIAPDELERRTGWAIRPDGACKGDICVPLPAGADARVLAEKLGMPLIREDAHGLWCLGPPCGGRTLTTAQAPDLELPDVEGRVFALRTLRGQKVLLVAWASW